MLQVEAVQFHKFMSNGRTKPALMTCVDAHGVRSEYVVKLRASECAASGLLNEVLASELAEHFCIPHPSSAIVIITEDLVAALELLLEAQHVQVFASSLGPNFGTVKMNNLTTFVQDRYLDDKQMQNAFNIFAFDTLVQNPDRSRANPNLGLFGNEIEIYDHDSAFSFCSDIFYRVASADQRREMESWRATKQAYGAQHVLYRALARQTHNTGFFYEKLRNLPEHFVVSLSDALPAELRTDTLPMIDEYLSDMPTRASVFIEDLLRRLA